MVAAIFALAGALVGVLGTVLVDFMGARRADRHTSQEALRTVCSDFTSQVARVRRISLQLKRESTQERWFHLEDAFTEARASYERLRITAESLATQEAARHVIHFAYWMTRAAHNESDGLAEAESELFNWLAKLYAEVRRELGLRRPDDVYKDPPEGLKVPIIPYRSAPVEGSKEGD